MRSVQSHIQNKSTLVITLTFTQLWKEKGNVLTILLQFVLSLSSFVTSDSNLIFQFVTEIYFSINDFTAVSIFFNRINLVVSTYSIWKLLLFMENMVHRIWSLVFRICQLLFQILFGIFHVIIQSKHTCLLDFFLRIWQLKYIKQ